MGGGGGGGAGHAVKDYYRIHITCHRTVVIIVIWNMNE